MRNLFFLFLLLSSALVSASPIKISTFINSKNCDQVLDKTFYTICYSYKAKGANYVAYTLNGSMVNVGNIKKRPRFYPDKSIPIKYRTYPGDYTHNEYHADRGHLAPDADFDYSYHSLKSVYSMANIIPQYYKINRRTWSKAERYERLIATKLGQVTVINGVVYGQSPLKRMRKSGIAYPVAYWKLLFNNKKGFKRCLYYKNNSHVDVKRDKLKDHLVDCKRLH